MCLLPAATVTSTKLRDPCTYYAITCQARAWLRPLGLGWEMRRCHGFISCKFRIEGLTIKQIALKEGTELHRVDSARDQTAESHRDIACRSSSLQA